MSDSERRSSNKSCHGRPARPPWDRSEDSCGELITKLPGPRGKSVWMAVGRAADVWQHHLSSQILDTLGSSKTNDITGADLSLFMYMVGRDRLTASPRIIFCSSDIRTRKAIRRAVEGSGILNDYPSIGLGDSSSPLARADSGLCRRAPDLPTPPKPRVRRSDRRRDAGEPGKLDGHAQRVQAGSEAALVPPAAGGNLHEPEALRGTLEGMSITGSRSSTFSIDDSTYGTVTGSLDSNRSRCSTPTSSVHDMFPGEHRTHSNTPTVKALDRDTSDSDRFDSADDPESYSESDEMEENTPMTPGSFHPAVARELNPIFVQLHIAYDMYQRHAAGSDNQRSRSGESTGTSSAESSSLARVGAGKDGTPVSRGKRSFSGQDDDEDALATDSKRAKVSSPNGEAFACPYWKKDAQTYSRCCKFKFEDVRRVKQHLDRRHVKTIRCPRCQGKFETRISCDDHIRDADCARQPKIMDEGIDQDQKDRLSKKGQATQSQFQRWYVVWRIVFPGIVEPVSPYNDDDGLSEFLRLEGPAIILGHMRQLPNWNQDDEDRFGQVPSRIILDIERQWVAQRAQGNCQTAVGGTADLPDKEPPTDLALDPSPSPPNAQGVHGPADGVGDGNDLDLPLFPGDVALPGVSGEFSMLDGGHYLNTEDDPVPCDQWIWDEDLNRSTFQ
ncbi:hypothetical protein B0T18DRAFT_395736 [Schizothecium vesticola]|uniref:C2H2-type domain-containing protein n=1 Tax=Schizothecium vesticola TaxID=314040 RepID=A0AA40F865_9PEZI|nr:hypothetical protein B0T18DRAFT_395736 [Schizothecium vesticola]